MRLQGAISKGEKQTKVIDGVGACTWRAAREGMRECVKGRGETMLMKKRALGSKAFGAGTVVVIPPGWKFSMAQVVEMLAGV